MRKRHPHLPVLLALGACLAAVVATPAPTRALDVDLDLVVQMPVAVSRVDAVGYPESELALLASSLIEADVEPGDFIEILRWAPVALVLGEQTFFELDRDPDDFELVLLTRDELDRLQLDPDLDLELFRLVELEGRGDLVVFDPASFALDRGLEPDDFDELDDLDGRRVRGPGMGAFVQVLLDEGLRGRELSRAIHRELRRRGARAGGEAWPDGPPPADPGFATVRLQRDLGLAEASLRDRDVYLEAAARRGRPEVPPGQAGKIDGDDPARALPPGQARKSGRDDRPGGARPDRGKPQRARGHDKGDGRGEVARGRGNDGKDRGQGKARGGGPPQGKKQGGRERGRGQGESKPEHRGGKPPAGGPPTAAVTATQTGVR